MPTRTETKTQKRLRSTQPKPEPSASVPWAGHQDPLRPNPHPHSHPQKWQKRDSLGPQKRQKTHDSSLSHDSPSKISLTRQALHEHNQRIRIEDKRNRRTSLDHRYLPPSPPLSPSPPLLEPCLSLKALQQSAKHGGPDLRDIRQYPLPRTTMKRSRGSISKTTHTSRSSAAKDAASSKVSSTAHKSGFEQALEDEAHIHLPVHANPKPPLDGLHNDLARQRSSVSSSTCKEMYEAFMNDKENQNSEAKVRSNIVPVLKGRRNNNFKEEEDLQFIAFSPGTSKPEPDYYDGAFRKDIDKTVLIELESSIDLTKQYTAGVAPNFFLEVKGPNGNPRKAMLQACHYGAYGARAMQALRTYGQELSYDGNAYTITSTYIFDTAQIRLYTTHPSAFNDSSTEYFTTQVGSYDLSSNSKSFKEGVTAFRNARDWAKDQREKLIASARASAEAAGRKADVALMSDPRNGNLSLKRPRLGEVLLVEKRRKSH